MLNGDGLGTCSLMIFSILSSAVGSGQDSQLCLLNSDAAKMLMPRRQVLRCSDHTYFLLILRVACIAAHTSL